MKRYDPATIEPEWQRRWATTDIYTAVDFSEKQKFVMLTEFPYPSGDGLHIGHTREYTLGDVIARYKRMQGYNVLYPMGYDAFGLPTENYAIKHKIRPQEATDRNVANFQNQFERLGLSIDWSRSFRTSDPEYYRWTQWLFLQFVKHGLAYQDDSFINWCPKCKTGLANEEVVNGVHERCDTGVEKKQLRQWMLKITAYAEQLIEGLKTVDYPRRIADQQINWIGKSKGAEVTFHIAHDEVRSFIMGQKDISVQDIETLGGRVVRITTEGYLCVVVPASKIADFEALIVAKMQPGFWNEYIGDETVFIFKDTQGNTRRCVWTAETESDILSLCQSYAGVEFSSITSMLSGNDWYKELFSNSETNDPMSITVFTTRPDTLFGATFMVLAPEHPLVARITTAEQRADVEAYLKLTQAKSEIERQEQDREKTGVFTGASAINPVNGEHIPIWVADFVLAGYGTGAVFADACDERDFAFAKKFNIPLKPTVIPEHDVVEAEKVMNLTYAFTGEGVLVNSGVYTGMASAEARDRIVADLVAQGVAREKVNYKLRDWVFSRQHYWGEPIPIIHCSKCGAVPVPDDQLPVVLPDIDHYEPTDTGESPLATATDWVNTTCPTCGKPALRETDTMPNWAGSSWYYLRYYDAHNTHEFAARNKLEYWGAVDFYLGGMEHTTLHLLYSRFWHRFFYDIGLVPTAEPYEARRGQGIILAEDGRKMSKSLGNVLNPLAVINDGYGADALRLAIAFISPYEQTTPWDPKGVAGTYRFLSRVWTLVQEYIESRVDGTLPLSLVHKTIRAVSHDLDHMNFNTAIAKLMLYVNDLYKLKLAGMKGDDWRYALEVLVQLIAPFAPHIAEALWADLGQTSSVHTSRWPQYDEGLLVQETCVVVLQVNGKVRATIDVPVTCDDAELERRALDNDRVRASLGDKHPTKVIVVPHRLVNVVTG